MNAEPKAGQEAKNVAEEVSVGSILTSVRDVLTDPSTNAKVWRESCRIGAGVLAVVSRGCEAIENAVQPLEAPRQRRFSGIFHTLGEQTQSLSQACALEKQKERLFEAIVRKQKEQHGIELNVWTHWAALTAYAEEHSYLGTAEHMSSIEQEFKSQSFSCPRLRLAAEPVSIVVAQPAAVAEPEAEARSFAEWVQTVSSPLPSSSSSVQPLSVGTSLQEPMLFLGPAANANPSSLPPIPTTPDHALVLAAADPIRVINNKQ